MHRLDGVDLDDFGAKTSGHCSCLSTLRLARAGKPQEKPRRFGKDWSRSQPF